VKQHLVTPLDRYLVSGETLQLRTGPHWVVLTRAIAVATIFLAFAATLAYASIRSAPQNSVLYSVLASVGLAIGTAVIASAMVRRASHVVLVTERRILEITGFLSRTTTEIKLDAILSCTVDQNVVARLFNYGTITLRTASDAPMVLYKIAFPLELHQALQDHKTLEEENHLTTARVETA